MTTLPEADYVVLGSRIALGLDGGFAVAVPARVRLLEASGAREPLMLSVDGQPSDVHAAQRQAFVDAGLLARPDVIRNLFDELRDMPEWLWNAGVPGERTPSIGYTTVRDAAGTAVVSLPVFENDPEWHLRDAAVVLHAPGADRVVRGFRGLYIAWLEHIAEERRGHPAIPTARSSSSSSRGRSARCSSAGTTRACGWSTPCTTRTCRCPTTTRMLPSRACGDAGSTRPTGTTQCCGRRARSATTSPRGSEIPAPSTSFRTRSISARSRRTRHPATPGGS